MSEALEQLAAPAVARLAERHSAREVAYAASRDAIRAAANAIRAVHRGEDERASRLLAEARSRLEVGIDAVVDHPSLAHGGFLGDAAKEVAEAALTRAAVAGGPLPSADAIGVDDVSWLHGLAETVGELRRAALDAVRAGDVALAEQRLATMQSILEVLVTVDVPDAITRGLRRATDGARAITERTRGDLTAAAGQARLRDALDRHAAALEAANDAAGET